MRNKIIKVISQKLKAIHPGAVIYLDSVMQSDKDLYFVLSVDPGGTENVGINVQNESYLVDIALVDNKGNKTLVNNIVSQCGAFFNVLLLDGQIVQPEDYLPEETDGVWHVRFTVAFPQYIEWSEE